MLGSTARKRDLDLMYLMAPFQHKVFYDSIRKTKLGKKKLIYKMDTATVS